MNNEQIALLQFARARKKIGFTHRDFNTEHYSTASTARLSELRAMGFVFRESQEGRTKIFFLSFEPAKYKRKSYKNSLAA